MRDYGKVHSTFWSSQTTATLSDDGKLLALYLMTCSHNTIAGVFRLPDGYVAEDIGWTAERVSKGFAELFAKGFANRCETTKWVWVVKHLDWNPPENPNQRKAAAKVSGSVPSSCAWKQEFVRATAEILGSKPPEAPNPSETVSEPFLNQEQEQEQEQEKEPNGSVAKGDRLPACPYDDIVAQYNELLPSLPAVRLMTEARKRALRSFWGWVLTSKKSDNTRRAVTADQAMTWIRGYFERAAQNDFLMGRGSRSAEHANWQCTLDFLLTDKGKSHVIEKTREAA
jgi:hypothetical protein